MVSIDESYAPNRFYNPSIGVAIMV